MKRAVLVVLMLLFWSSWIALAQQTSAPKDQPKKAAAESRPKLRIIKDDLVEVGGGYFYAVKGTVYNPNDKAVRNVVIKYYIWKKWMGREGQPSRLIKETGGLVLATIKYIPPKQSVEFTASSRNAPVMSVQSGLLPDPPEPEITAEWDIPKRPAP